MKRFFLVLAILCGCGGVPDVTEVFQPTDNCLGPYYVKGAAVLNPVALRQDETMLKALFTTPWVYHPQDHDGNLDYTRTFMHDRLLQNDKEFCDSFGGVHITLEWDHEFTCGDQECWGLDNSRGIFLEYSANSFLHELLHVYEWERGVMDTFDHPDWDKKGYHYLNDVVWWHARSPNPLVGVDGGSFP